MQVLSNGVPVTTDAEHFAPMRDSTELLGDPEKLRAHFQQDGYVYLRGVLDREKVMALRGFYFGMFDPSYFQPGTSPEAGIWSGNVPAGQLSHGVAGHPAHTLVRSPEFADFAAAPELESVARALLDEDQVFQLPRQIVRHFNKGPLSSRAHTDFDYMDKGSAHIITMWLPIGDCPVQSGGLAYLEGSHTIPKQDLQVLKSKRTDRPGDARPISHDLDWTAQQLGGRRWLYADYEAGDVAIHSPHLVHASLDTQTDMMRMSVDVRFLPKSVEPDPRWLTKWAGDDGN
jgi:ectoine hydroxylase-related dioxygenase (phytanoyl-CoA dioxygenase family)